MPNLCDQSLGHLNDRARRAARETCPPQAGSQSLAHQIHVRLPIEYGTSHKAGIPQPLKLSNFTAIAWFLEPIYEL